MNTYWISLPCDLLSSLASFQCSLLHHLHLSSDLGLSKYVNQHSHLNLSRNVRLSVLYDLDFNMMSGIPHHLRKKYTSKHPPSLDLLPHQDPWQPQRHLNPTSPLPTSKRGLKGMPVPIPSSRMKGTTTPSFATSRQLPRHKD